VARTGSRVLRMGPTLYTTSVTTVCTTCRTRELSSVRLVSDLPYVGFNVRKGDRCPQGGDTHHCAQQYLFRIVY
jgi:hypothetical protein